jgi:hypothetical protein
MELLSGIAYEIYQSATGWMDHDGYFDISDYLDEGADCD